MPSSIPVSVTPVRSPEELLMTATTDVQDTAAELLVAEAPAQEAAKTRRFSRPKLGVTFAVVFLLTLTFMAIFADYLPFIRYPGSKVKVDGKSTPYGLGPGWTAWFGTDRLAGDVFAKCIYGARVTLQVGVFATIFGIVAGGTLGVLGGYFRGWVDRVVSIITDCLLALPALLLAIILVNRLDDYKDDVEWLGWLSRKWQI